MDEQRPVAWRAIIYGTPVVSTDAGPVGTVREVLGADAEDIFHGVRIHLRAGGRDVMVPAEDIVSMTTATITTDLPAADIEALPDATDEATYHLASVGWLRHHLGWRRDDRGDEEPG